MRLAIVAVCAIALSCNRSVPKEVPKTDAPPFAVSIVPARSDATARGISMAADTLDTFYVVLTNVSPQPQAAFETWNSWGYYAVSFELRTPDGRVAIIKKTLTVFTKNNPSTFVIPVGEQMVYPIKLDDEWAASAPLPIADEQPIDITLKAVYELKATTESKQQNVWTGRVESPEYHFKFRHWVKHS